MLVEISLTESFVGQKEAVEELVRAAQLLFKRVAAVFQLLFVGRLYCLLVRIECLIA